jgi:hypothetical protein
MCSLDRDSDQARLFRLQSFLGHCPIVSTTPEQIEANLRELVTNPDRRVALGEAGRDYVARFHSHAMAHYLFGAVYARILDGAEMDLMRLFDPLSSDYVRAAA